MLVIDRICNFLTMIDYGYYESLGLIFWRNYFRWHISFWLFFRRLIASIDFYRLGDSKCFKRLFFESFVVLPLYISLISFSMINQRVSSFHAVFHVLVCSIRLAPWAFRQIIRYSPPILELLGGSMVPIVHDWYETYSFRAIVCSVR